MNDVCAHRSFSLTRNEPNKIAVDVSTNSINARYATAESVLTDRRNAIRVTHQGSFPIRPLLNNGIGDAVHVVLQDLSMTGMGALHSHPMQHGEQYQIPLTQEPGAGMSLICTVVRCDRLDEGLYSIGFEFNSPSAAIDAGVRQLAG